MKLATVKHQNKVVTVAVNKDATALLPLQQAAAACFREGHPSLATMEDIISGGKEVVDLIRRLVIDPRTQWLTAEEAEWLPPIPRPQKNIFCVGKNYADHAIEMGSKKDIPQHVMLFSKAPTTVIGHNEPIPLHAGVTDALDYEGELAVVIGKRGKSIKKEESSDYIFGYTILNDVTARDLQSRHKQFLLGKSLDGSCPMGPYIVTKEELPFPEALHIMTKVNGEIRQNGNTGQFIFPIAEVIETLSRGMTLEPGDIIATGTPAGVGKGFKPPKYLASGDIIEITIEQIGTLRNEVR
ncbi:MAG: fumarylacetoacetate hydrolase family protein [Bacillus sp. (in: firmicutes)]